MLRSLVLHTWLSPRPLVVSHPARSFTGKTESGFKFKTPKMRMLSVKPVYPPPGLNLRIPEGLTPEQFCKQIGGDCAEFADKFESIDEIFSLDSVRRDADTCREE